MKISDGFVYLGNGVKVHYLRYGKAGIKLVLLHGWAGSSLIWRRYIEEAKDKYEITAFDIPGFGDSAKMENGYALPKLSSYIYMACKKLGIDNPVIIGHSMGGQLAMYIAACHKNFPRALIVVDSAERPAKPVSEWLRRAEQSDYRTLIEGLVPTFFDKLSSKESALMVKEGLKMTRASTIGTLNAIMRMKLYRRIADISCPTLLVFGEHDKNRSIEELQNLKKSIKGSELIIIKNSKHAPMYENTEDFCRVVDSFLAKL